jgi:predicted permease
MSTPSYHAVSAWKNIPVGVLGDIRHSLRLIWRRPGFSILVILSMAIGIGAASSALSVLYASIVRPVPYERPEQLFRVRIETVDDGRKVPADPSLEQVDVWAQEATDVLLDIAAAQAHPPIVLTDGTPRRTGTSEVWTVTPSYFRMFAVSPAVGRAFTPADSRAEAAPVGIIGYRYFHEVFNGDRSVLGRVIHFRARGENADRAVEIVGVLPEEYWKNVILVLPMNARGEYRQVFARLRPGSEGSAAARLRSLATAGPVGPVQLSSMVSESARDLNPVQILILAIASGVILCLACINVSTIGLASSASRSMEAAVRASLGAGRRVIVQQVLTEHLVFGAIAALLGIALYSVSIQFVVTSFGEGLLPSQSEPRLEWQVWVAVSVVVLLAAVASGLAPAIQSSRFRSATLLGGGAGGRSTVPLTASRVFLGIQAAVTIVGVIGCGLLVRSYAGMVSAESGFSLDRVVAANVAPVDQDDRAIVRSFFVRILDRVREKPSVEAAGLTNAFRTAPVTRASVEGGAPLSFSNRQVSPGALEALGVRLLSGRLFASGDLTACPDCVVISEGTVRALAGSGVPANLVIGGKARPVIGVVGDVNFSAPYVSLRPDVYTLMTDVSAATTSVVFRPRGNVAEAVRLFPAAARAVGVPVVIDRIRSGSMLLDERVLAARQKALLGGAVGFIGLVLACVGVAAVTAYSVMRQVQEIAIRSALGATPRTLIRGVVTKACRPVFVGIAMGLCVAAFATRMLSALVFGISTTDVVTYSACALALTVASCCAAYLPARGACRLSPGLIMRSR